MQPSQFKLTKKWVLFFDKHGYGFAGAFVIYPAILIHYHRGYFQISLSWFKRTISLTLFKIW